MAMKNPVHPGSIVREDCINASALNVTEAAKQLGVTRQALNNVVNEKSAISPEMALRLEKMGWSSADAWLRMQMAYDLAKVRARSDEIKVQVARRDRSAL
ncbi:MAG: HigA family addiction module antitoxin [Pseudomonadota bacterium]